MSATTVDEIAERIYRIHTPLPPSVLPGGFSFNQYLIAADEPLLFHTGPRKLFPAVSAALARVVPLERLRWISFSHHEQDEDGALDELLAAAPHAQAVCGRVQAMINGDGMAREPRVLPDEGLLELGSHRVRWIDAPHVPHGWESGLLIEETTRTLLCGDLFTQPGTGDAALVESDILGPSEALRRAPGLDYFAHGRDLDARLERLAALQPTTLACMHGSAWRGDGARLLRELARVLASG